MNSLAKYDDSSSAISLYLNSISKFQILNKDEEVELGKRILNGEQEAINSLVETNLKLVVYLAKKYVPVGKCRGYSFLDLISYGNLGLLRAAQMFDYRKNIRFATYARWWIKNYILSAIQDGGMIRLPANRQRKSSWLLDRVKESKNLGSEKDDALLMQEVKDNAQIKYVYIDNVNKLYDGSEVSKDNKDFMADHTSDQFIHDIERRDIKAKVNRALDKINNRDKEVLEYMYLKDSCTPRITRKTKDGYVSINNGYREVGKVLGISHERVRQMKQRGLKKLKDLLVSRGLKPETIF